MSHSIVVDSAPQANFKGTNRAFQPCIDSGDTRPATTTFPPSRIAPSLSLSYSYLNLSICLSSSAYRITFRTKVVGMEWIGNNIVYYLRGLRERGTMRGGQQRDRGREEGEAPGGGVEGHGNILMGRGSVSTFEEKRERRRGAVHGDDDDHGEDDEKDVGGEDASGCPEALLPGALTRRLSACRPRLTLPPSSSSTSSSSSSSYKFRSKDCVRVTKRKGPPAIGGGGRREGKLTTNLFSYVENSLRQAEEERRERERDGGYESYG